MRLQPVPRRYEVLLGVARTGPGTPEAHFGVPRVLVLSNSMSLQRTPKLCPGGPKNVQNLSKMNPKMVPRRSCPPPKLGPITARNCSKCDPKTDPSKFVQKGAGTPGIFSLWHYKFQGFFDRRPGGPWGFWGPFWCPILGSRWYRFICIYCSKYLRKVLTQTLGLLTALILGRS